MTPSAQCPSTPISSTCDEEVEGSSDYGSTEDSATCKCMENDGEISGAVQCLCGIDREFEEPNLETNKDIERDELAVN